MLFSGIFPSLAPTCVYTVGLGWEWVKGVLYRGWRLFSTLSLSGDIDQHPAIASQKPAQKSLEREFRVRTFSYAS